MSHAFHQLYYHFVWATHSRDPHIHRSFRPEFLQLLHEEVKTRGGIPIRHNAMPDHVHLLLRYPPNLAHSDLLRHVKGRSSKWINETFPALGRFSWQEGYGGFTVSKSSVSQVERYILNQKAHHETLDFKTEFLELLRKHGVEFDEGDVFR